MPLTDTACRQAKPKEKDYKLTDGEGLFLLVKINGSKYWRLKYRYGGKEKLLAIGVYPHISIREARSLTSEAKRQLKTGVDPSELRKLKKITRSESLSNSFEAIALEWYAKKQSGWSESHRKRQLERIENNLFPWLGSRPITDISPSELLAVLRRIESRGALETAKRIKQIAGSIFKYAISTSRAQIDPSTPLEGALASPVTKHFSAVTDPNEVGPLLNILDNYRGTAVVRAALRIAPLTFVRPGELRTARWKDINFETSEWRFFVTKTKSHHIVPLSKQVLEALQELRFLTGRSEFVFPGARSARRPMSDNAVLSALRSCGIPKEEMCGHGFRAMARTILDEELGFRVDHIEHQLAHEVKDSNGRAYNRTAHLPARKKMMQAWADYLDELKRKANVINLSSGDHAFKV